MTRIPSSTPMCDIASGIANTPAPTIVLTRLITLESHDACPATPVSFLCLDLLEEAALAGLELCSSGEPVIAA